MKCSNCKTNNWKINIIPCCDDCSENPAYSRNENGGSYWKSVYDEKIIDELDLTREGVEADGECRMGVAYGAGCYMMICSKCNKKYNLAVSDTCG